MGLLPAVKILHILKVGVSVEGVQKSEYGFEYNFVVLLRKESQIKGLDTCCSTAANLRLVNDLCSYAIVLTGHYSQACMLLLSSNMYPTHAVYLQLRAIN